MWLFECVYKVCILIYIVLDSSHTAHEMLLKVLDVWHCHTHTHWFFSHFWQPHLHAMCVYVMRVCFSASLHCFIVRAPLTCLILSGAARHRERHTQTHTHPALCFEVQSGRLEVRCSFSSTLLTFFGKVNFSQVTHSFLIFPSKRIALWLLSR